MAGSIPPLVSSSPPPLCSFDDDEEEDEDGFGGYTGAEELDFNERISYGGKAEEKQGGNKLQGEQDSTSQDSATDSGLCPDSEGMSPTPHSDDERQRVHLQLPNGHLEPADDPTPTESADFEFPSAVKKESTSCDVAGLSAQESEVCDGVTPTVEETLDEHDTNLFHKFQESSGRSNIVSPSDSEQKSKPENSNLLNTDVIDSIVSCKNLLYNEKDSYRSEAFVNEDNDNFEDFKEFSESKTIIKSLSEICTEDENDSFQDFKVCTGNEDMNISTKSYPFKSNSDNHSSCSSEPQLSEHQNQDVILENQRLENNAHIPLRNEDQKDTKEIDSLQDEDDDFSDFTDFKTSLPTFNEIPETEGNHLLKHLKKNSELKDSFDEPPQQDESEDEFSNFADFSSSSCAFVSAQSSNSVESTAHFQSKPCDDTDLRTDSEFQDWVSVFPSGVDDCSAPPSALLEPEDPVWVRLVLPEASPALSLQWAACLAYSNLLAALHIDSRNILWNSGVPRFAATLSRGPLQPVKAAETLPPLQPTAASALQPHPPPSVAPPSATQESVPDAHFDWGSSGLTNPLDSGHSSLLDLHFLVDLSTRLTINPKPVLSLPKTLSAEAEAILSSLRDLSFIRKNYIVFPINET